MVPATLRRLSAVRDMVSPHKVVAMGETPVASVGGAFGRRLFLWRYVKMIELQYESNFDGFLMELRIGPEVI